MREGELEEVFFFLIGTWRKACVPASYVVQQGRKKKKLSMPPAVCVRGAFSMGSRCGDAEMWDGKKKKKKPSDNWGGSMSGHVIPWSCVCGHELQTADDLRNQHRSLNRSHIWELVPPTHVPSPGVEPGDTSSWHTHRMYTAALAAWRSQERADRGRNGARLVYSRSALLTMHHCCLMRWSKACVWPGVTAMYSDRKTC